MAGMDKIKRLQAFKAQFDSDKVVVPSNLDEIIRTTDELARAENADNLSGVFREALPIFSAVLSNSYKRRINDNRREALKNLRAEGGSIKKRSSGGGGKIPRESAVPEEYYKCRSPTAMAALVVFCTNAERSQVRRAALLAAVSGEFKNVHDTLKAIRDPKSLIADADEQNLEPKLETMGRIVQALMEASEITRDKNPAKLAMELDETLYGKAAEHYLQRQTFKTMHPYEPLRTRYLKDCVGQIFMKIEHDKITNQHKIDPQRTIRFLLDSVYNNAPCSVANNHHPARKTRSVSVKFDTNKAYQVFVGPINYLSTLMATNYKFKGRVYRILTYNDCLYDVVGSHLEDFNGSDQKADSLIYNGMSWKERLNLLPYRAKIELREMTGHELNDFQGHAMLTVSWMDGDLEISKPFEVRSERRGRAND